LRVAVEVAAAHEASDGSDGYRRVHSELVDNGTVVSVHTLRRLMPFQQPHLAGT
jgi:hypothetical protein